MALVTHHKAEKPFIKDTVAQTDNDVNSCRVENGRRIIDHCYLHVLGDLYAP